MSETIIIKKEQSKEQPNFIQIKPDGINYGYHSRFIEEKNGMYSWYLPSFDIYFSSSTKEEGEKRSLEMTESFFNYWLQKKGFRTFLMQILRLGYQARSHKELQGLLNRKNLNAQLRASTIKELPAAFRESETSRQEGNLATAV